MDTAKDVFPLSKMLQKNLALLWSLRTLPRKHYESAAMWIVFCNGKNRICVYQSNTAAFYAVLCGREDSCFLPKLVPTYILPSLPASP